MYWPVIQKVPGSITTTATNFEIKNNMSVSIRTPNHLKMSVDTTFTMSCISNIPQMDNAHHNIDTMNQPLSHTLSESLHSAVCTCWTLLWNSSQIMEIKPWVLYGLSSKYYSTVFFFADSSERTWDHYFQQLPRNRSVSPFLLCDTGILL